MSGNDSQECGDDIDIPRWEFPVGAKKTNSTETCPNKEDEVDVATDECQDVQEKESDDQSSQETLSEEPTYGCTAQCTSSLGSSLANYLEMMCSRYASTANFTTSNLQFTTVNSHMGDMTRDMQDNQSNLPQTATSETPANVLTSRTRYNTEVDPAKYRVVIDNDTNTRKYACSICGNLYKWRKSLNKHWKEKHRNEVPPPLDAEVIVNIKNNCNIAAAPVQSECTKNVISETVPNPENESISKDFAKLHIYSDSSPVNDKSSDKHFNSLYDTGFLHSPTAADAIRTSATGQNMSSPLSASRCLGSLDTRRMLSNCNAGNESNDTTTQNTNELLNEVKQDCKRYSKQLKKACQKSFSCGVCDMSSTSVQEINDHFCACHMNMLVKEMTEKSAPRNTNVAEQNEKLRLSDPDIPLKCAQCPFVGRWPTELQKHAASHSDSRPFKCLVCSLTYKWRWDLAKHFDRSHHPLPNPYKKRDRDAALQCENTKRATSNGMSTTAERFPVEGAQESNMESLVPLTNSPQDNSDVDIITDLLAKFPNANSLLAALPENLDSFHSISQALGNLYYKMQNSNQQTLNEPTEICKSIQQLNDPRNSATLGCCWCDFVAKWKSDLLQHKRCNHSRVKVFHCSNCSYSSNWKWDVQKHLRSQHTEYTNRCLIEFPNSFLFANIPIDQLFSQLRIENIESGDEPVNENIRDRVIETLTEVERAQLHCNKCPMIFTCKSEADKHNDMVHGQFKRYKCTDCDYCAKWKINIKDHMQDIHQKKGNFKILKSSCEKVNDEHNMKELAVSECFVSANEAANDTCCESKDEDVMSCDESLQQNCESDITGTESPQETARKETDDGAKFMADVQSTTATQFNSEDGQICATANPTTPSSTEDHLLFDQKSN